MNRNIKKIRALALLLSISLSLTGCKQESSNEIIQNIKTNIEEFIDSTFEDEQIKENNIEVKYDKLTQNYLDYFKSLQFDYNYQEKYITDDEINKIIESTNTVSNCNYVFDGDIKKIVEQIKNNTKNFIKQNTGFNEAIISKDYENILNRILKSIYENGSNNLDEDFHKISTISIVYGSTEELNTAENNDYLYLAYYDEDLNAIILNKDYIELVAQNEIVSFDYELSYILEHELNHVRQINCECKEKDEFSFNKISYSKYITLLLESSAESWIYNQTESNFEEYSYDLEREKEAEILTLGLLSNKSIEEYYSAIFDNDLNKLFKFCNLEETEVYDFYRILYSMDGYLCRNELPFEIISEDEEVTYGELESRIGFAYKENLFKLMIIDLLKYNATENISLEENLVIYNFMRYIAIRDCFTIYETEDSLERKYDEETIKSIYEMDEQYLSYLSTKYKVSKEKIRDMEYIDIYLIIRNIQNIVDGKEVDETYEDEAIEILNKYPIMANIFKSMPPLNFHSFYSYLNEINVKVYERSYQ